MFTVNEWKTTQPSSHWQPRYPHVTFALQWKLSLNFGKHKVMNFIFIFSVALLKEKPAQSRAF